MITEPIVLFGAPSSGTSIIHDVFVRHESVAFLNWRAVGSQPGRPDRMRWLLRAIDAPLVGDLLGRRVHPGECYAFWHLHFGGFSRPHRDLGAIDLSERVRKSLIAAFEEIPTERRNRLVLKVTGWPRVGFLDALFPDAHFVHIVRDGRSVANSLISRPFFDGWYGPTSWRFGELPKDQEVIWRRHGQSFVALAGIAWNLLERAAEEAREIVGEGRMTDLRYEDFCREPARSIAEVFQVLSMSASRKVDAYAAAARISERKTWDRDLTPSQIETLEAVLDDSLMKKWRYRG